MEIKGPTPVGLGPNGSVLILTGPGPENFDQSKTSSDLDRENFKNLGSTRVRNKEVEIGTNPDLDQIRRKTPILNIHIFGDINIKT